MTELKAHFDRNVARFLERHRIIGSNTFDQIWNGLSDEDRQFLEQGIRTNRWLYRDKLLHSERDPAREAKRAAEALTGARALIAVSVGAGYIFGSLGRGVAEVLVLELNPGIAAALILSGEFVKFHGGITLFVDNLSRPDALEEILPWLQGKNLKQTLIYCHPPFMGIDKAASTRAIQRIEALFEKRSVNQATIVKFQQLWNKNIFLNQRTIGRSAAMSSIWDIAPPEAIVLAGAGPSLQPPPNTPNTLRNRFVLFAADTAFVPLVKAGILPDFVFAADPQWLNHFFCLCWVCLGLVWVMDPVVVPAIPHYVERCGAPLFFWNNVFLGDGYFRKEDRGDVQHGGSVSTNAFDMARNWLGRVKKPARIILVGQDLSFSNRQAHTPGAVLEAQVFASSTRLRTMERHNFRQMTAMPVLKVRGIRQKEVRTNGKLRIFLDWFAAQAAETDRSALRLINATYDGAHMQGFEHATLTEALAGVTDYRFTYTSANHVPAPQTGQKARQLMADFRLIRSLMQENARLSAEKSPSHATFERLNRNDEKLKAMVPAKDIVALNAQALILKITEQGEAAAPAEFYGAMARAARELGHWLGKIALA